MRLLLVAAVCILTIQTRAAGPPTRTSVTGNFWFKDFALKYGAYMEQRGNFLLYLSESPIKTLPNGKCSVFLDSNQKSSQIVLTLSENNGRISLAGAAFMGYRRQGTFFDLKSVNDESHILNRFEIGQSGIAEGRFASKVSNPVGIASGDFAAVYCPAGIDNPVN